MNEIAQRFLAALRAGGLTNPHALGTVGSYGQNESGYSPNNISGSWNDPSQSGAPGTSGGILSWRGPRFNAMRNFTAGAADPVTAQANFFLQENPGLIARLNASRSVEDANREMARSWKFGGWDNPQGREYQERLAQSRGGGLLSGSSPAAGPVQTAAAPLTIDAFKAKMLERYPGLRITSEYRSPSDNKAAGGAKGSQHMKNLALDAGLKEFDDTQRAEIYNYARSLGARGIGYYPNSQSAHFDLRQGAPAAWGQNYSKTSLGQTPPWFQQLAAGHLKGEGIGGGDTMMASANPTYHPEIDAPGKQAPIVGAEPEGFMAGFGDAISKLAQNMEQPAPPPTPLAPPQTQLAQAPQQGNAADMMSSLLQQKRQLRGLLSGGFA